MMRKKLMLIGTSVACALSMFCGSLGNNKSVQSTNVATVRSGTQNIENNDSYFDYYKEENDDVKYKAVAKKRILSDSLLGYETVSLFDDEDYLITYELITNSEESTVTLNVYFDNTNEHIIEDFVGVPMTNYNDEHDVLFTIDDQHIFLSEILNSSSQEQCSLFGNILHKALNISMAAITYIEPIIKIFAYSSDNILILLYNTVKNTSYLINYGINSNKTQPNGYVYKQDKYSDWNFGFTNMKEAGCEVIAGYNLAYAKGRDFSLADCIFLYESLGIEIGLAQGFFGSNPYQISYFLSAIFMSYKKVTKYKNFENFMDDGNDYYVILSRWNNESAGAMIHTFMIDKDCDYSKKYHAYNEKYQNTSRDTNDYGDYFGGSINNTFICAYFVSK